MHYYFGIAAVLFVLSPAEKAGITSAWLERRQERGNVSELAVTNTALHCKVFSTHRRTHTHNSSVLYMLWSTRGGMLGKKIYEAEKPLQVHECNKKGLQSRGERTV